MRLPHPLIKGARNFLHRNAAQVENPGPILTQTEKEVGTHGGLAFYTIGQRKGLGVSSHVPLYVLQKDTARNALIIGPLEALGQRELTAGGVNWIAGEPPEGLFRCEVKIRYKARESAATVTPLPEGRVHVAFDEPLRDITPGQAAVFYAGEVCLGGGLIERP